MTDIQPTLKNASRKPYIYKVANLETGQYYIGSQCSGKTIGVNYFTSSTNKEFREEFKNYREEKYKIEIVKAFGDPEECVRVENYIIRNHMLLKDGLCLNRSYFCNGEKIFSTVGTHHAEETKKKISEVQKRRNKIRKQQGLSYWNKGTHRTEEERQKRSIALKGRPSPFKGTHHSEETKKRISEAHKIKISIKGITFESITEASKYYNAHITTIRYWLKNKKHNAVYIEK